MPGAGIDRNNNTNTQYKLFWEPHKQNLGETHKMIKSMHTSQKTRQKYDRKTFEFKLP